jgi:hypothetical protein
MKLMIVVFSSMLFLEYCVHDSKNEAVIKAASDFKSKYCGQQSIMHITWGNRYGEPVIHVEALSPTDVSEMKKLLPPSFNGFHVHVVAGLWNPGELVPDMGKKFEAMMEQDYYRRDSVGQRRAEEYLQLIESEELRIWLSWSAQERKDFIRRTLLNKRKRNSSFANCGDKFLQPD